MLNRVAYGVVLWAIPFVTSIPLLPLMRSDPVLFKTIMIVEGSIVGAVLAVVYFRAIERSFLREGIVLGAVWVVVNWLLDFVALLPFAGLSVPRYFLEIGLRYLAVAALTVAIGAALEQRASRGAST